MSIESIIESGNIDEIVAFLASIIPALDYKNNNIESHIDFKKITKIVEKNPTEYLDSVCVDAANLLRKKNIFTIASIKTDAYTYLLLDKLDQQNFSIFKEKYSENSNNYFIDHGNLDYFGIRVPNSQGMKSIEFSRLASDFKLQDVQRGFLNEKNFLMNVCNCEKVEGLKEFDNSNIQVVFDVKKMDKSFKEYLKESGYEKYYVQDEHRVYINDFYFEAHKNYLKETQNN